MYNKRFLEKKKLKHFYLLKFQKKVKINLQKIFFLLPIEFQKSALGEINLILLLNLFLNLFEIVIKEILLILFLNN